MIETIEVLLKEYELNSIENNNSNTTRLRNLEKKTGQMKRDLPVTEYDESLYIPSATLKESITSMVLAKGEHIGRGHTAYLTFATKTGRGKVKKEEEKEEKEEEEEMEEEKRMEEEKEQGSCVMF